MVQHTVTIANATGLHARPAALLVREAGKFPCTVRLKKGDKEVDAKSILGVLSLAVSPGQEVTLSADGPQDNDAIQALVALIESNFGEAN